MAPWIHFLSLPGTVILKNWIQGAMRAPLDPLPKYAWYGHSRFGVSMGPTGPFEGPWVVPWIRFLSPPGTGILKNWIQGAMRGALGSTS